MGRVFQPPISARVAQVEEGWKLEGGIPQVSRPTRSCTFWFPTVLLARMLHRVSHRSQTSCTADEAWTKLVAIFIIAVNPKTDSIRYIVLNRNGSANELEITSRSFNPLVLFNEMKCVHARHSLLYGSRALMVH